MTFDPNLVHSDHFALRDYMEKHPREVRETFPHIYQDMSSAWFCKTEQGECACSPAWEDIADAVMLEIINENGVMVLDAKLVLPTITVAVFAEKVKQYATGAYV